MGSLETDICVWLKNHENGKWRGKKDKNTLPKKFFTFINTYDYMSDTNNEKTFLRSKTNYNFKILNRNLF